MKIGIMQPYFFPYLGYFQLVNHVDKFVFYDDVNFIKKGWINRNKILINNDQCFFTIPLKGLSQNKKINEIKIDFNCKDRLKFMKSIEFSYKRAPYFKEVFELIKICVLSFDEDYISNLAINSIALVSDYLNINTKFIVSSKVHSKSVNLKGANRLVDICKKEKSRDYINPIGGQALYSKDEFNSQDINLKFLKSRMDCYKQFKSRSFVNNLSIIDVLMFNSKEDVLNLLNQYELE